MRPYNHNNRPTPAFSAYMRRRGWVLNFRRYGIQVWVSAYAWKPEK